MPDKWSVISDKFADAMSAKGVSSAVGLAKSADIGRATAERLMRGEGISLATAIKVCWALAGTGSPVTDLFKPAAGASL